MAMIKGITISYIRKIRTGTDPFGAPLWEESKEDVGNVLVAPASSVGITTSTDLNGKKMVYTLAIPKGDTHEWTDCEVEFFGHRWRSVGFPQKGIEDLVPLDWNQKVTVETYG